MVNKDAISETITDVSGSITLDSRNNVWDYVFVSGTNFKTYGNEKTAPAGPANLKSYNGLAIASMKSIMGLGIADIKSVNGII